MTTKSIIMEKLLKEQKFQENGGYQATQDCVVLSSCGTGDTR